MSLNIHKYHYEVRLYEDGLFQFLTYNPKGKEIVLVTIPIEEIDISRLIPHVGVEEDKNEQGSKYNWITLERM